MATTGTTATPKTDDKSTAEAVQDNVTDIKEKGESRVSKFKAHPATKRAIRNSVRLGIVGLGYTILDEGLNRTSFKETEPRIAVLWQGRDSDS